MDLRQTPATQAAQAHVTRTRRIQLLAVCESDEQPLFLSLVRRARNENNIGERKITARKLGCMITFPPKGGFISSKDKVF